VLVGAPQLAQDLTFAYDDRIEAARDAEEMTRYDLVAVLCSRERRGQAAVDRLGERIQLDAVAARYRETATCGTQGLDRVRGTLASVECGIALVEREQHERGVRHGITTDTAARRPSQIR
jgi:hypothetical protein